MRHCFLFLATGLFFAQTALGLIPDRRRLYEDRRENVYMVIPAVASLPGAGVFVGVLGSFSNLGGSGIDAAVTQAQTMGGDSDIYISAYALREVPLFLDGLTLEYWFGNIQLNEFNAYLPGRNSPDFTIPYTGKFKYYFLNPAYRFWERRINLTYNLVFFNGYAINEDGEDMLTGSHAASGNLLLDFTDDWVDPHKGLRLGYGVTLDAPSKSILGEDSKNTQAVESKNKDYSATLYIPTGDDVTWVAHQQWFTSSSGEGGWGGGAINLRGYPGGRWSDRYGKMQALEVRYTDHMSKEFDFVLAQGVLDGLQYAAFYEQGQVSPALDERLNQDLHRDYGVGMRALIDAIVLRLDLAFSEAGPQTHLTIDQPF